MVLPVFVSLASLPKTHLCATIRTKEMLGGNANDLGGIGSGTGPHAQHYQ